MRLDMGSLGVWEMGIWQVGLGRINKAKGPSAHSEIERILLHS